MILLPPDTGHHHERIDPGLLAAALNQLPPA
jgi:hypothetical protein